MARLAAFALAHFTAEEIEAGATAPALPEIRRVNRIT